MGNKDEARERWSGAGCRGGGEVGRVTVAKQLRSVGVKNEAETLGEERDGSRLFSLDFFSLSSSCPRDDKWQTLFTSPLSGE
jgi:hypothetical protein